MAIPLAAQTQASMTNRATIANMRLAVALWPACCGDPRLRLMADDVGRPTAYALPGEALELVLECVTCKSTCIDAGRLIVNFRPEGGSL